MSSNKGNKRRKWLKDGIKTSRRWYKKIWSRRVRHSKEIYDNCEYKKLAKYEVYKGVP